MLTLRELMTTNVDQVVKMRHQCIGITRTFATLEMKNGIVYVETVSIDSDGMALTELFYATSKQATFLTLINRSRTGGQHHSMRSYQRDNDYPIYSKVRVRNAITN